MTAMGLVKNWSGLMAARFFLGVFESGLFPGVNYFISCWYRRDEFALRAVSSPLHLHRPMERIKPDEPL